MDAHRDMTAKAATEHAVLYAYPLLAYQTKYRSLAPLIGINNLGHMLRLATSQARSTVKPNADTIYSSALYDVSQHDLYIDIPALPGDQYALFSFHDLYGNNFAVLGQEVLTEAGSFRLTYGVRPPTLGEPQERYITSPTTFGTLLVRWLFKDGNLDTIHSLQKATTVKAVPRQVQAQIDDIGDNPPLTSIDWSADIRPHAALRLLRQVGALNTPGRLAGATVQEVLQISSFCTHDSDIPSVDADALERYVLAKMKSAGEASLVSRNNGWSVIRSDSAGNFGDDYRLRAQISITGYLMLQAPAALYPSWSDGSTNSPLQGDVLELGAGESYLYTFSGKPPLDELGFWSLAVYDADGYLIKNARNVFSLGDRSSITYPTGDLVYSPTSSPNNDEPFQLLVQPADITPPENWLSNWIPGPSGGGKLTALLRFYNAGQELLDGRYQFPVVSKQKRIVDTVVRAQQ